MLRAADSVFGRILYILCFLLLPILKNNSANYKKILVIKLWAIGESILMLPSIKALKEKGYDISVVCTDQNKSVFEKQKFISEIIGFDINPLNLFAFILKIRKRQFSICADCEPYTKFSAVLGVLSGAGKRYGFENRKLLYSNHIKINENEHAAISFSRIFSEFGKIKNPVSLVPIPMKPVNFNISKKSIAIHAGSASSSKIRRWPEKNFAALCDYLSKKGYNIFLVGSFAESEINSHIIDLCETAHPVNLAGKISINQLAYLFSKMSLVIANDSGPMHISAAMGVPTIGLFGPNVPERYGPYGSHCIGIRKDKGPPCILPFRAKFPECDHVHMEKIKIQDVIEASNKYI